MLGPALQVAGLGFEAFGAYEQYQAAKKQSQISQQEVGVEQQQEAVRHQAMELQSSRQSKQELRRAQMARSMAINTATNQGAQFGSGLQGGLAGISGQTGTNQLGISQNLALGESMFGLNNQLSQLKIQMAGTQSQSSLGAMFGSIGGGLMGAGNSWSRGSGSDSDRRYAATADQYGGE